MEQNDMEGAKNQENIVFEFNKKNIKFLVCASLSPAFPLIKCSSSSSQ